MGVCTGQVLIKKELNMRNLLLIGLLFFLVVSCEKNTIEKAPIDGTWVEITQKTDTLVFDNQNPWFILNRERELRNGRLLSKYPSGAYIYETGKDSINLRRLASSSSYGNNYYFKVDSKNGQIRNGNFFVDSLGKNVILTFSKIP
jgi:hypothetical protein